jgi:Mn-dependent DtxR family transcriptional regulator
MGSVKVTPERIKVLVCLGAQAEGTNTAEAISDTLDMAEDEVIEALDGMIEAGIVEDIDVTFFTLTEEGMKLFQAFYQVITVMTDGMGKV